MTSPASILVIDDEDSICLAFKRFFEDRGWSVSLAASAQEGLAICRQSRPTVVFLDVRLPDRSGLDILDDIATGPSDVIVITAYGGLDTVIRAIHGRAYDYLFKPLDLDKALALANRVRENHGRSGPVSRALRGTDSGLLIGNSPAMHDVYKMIARTAVSASPVLIQGQTGTGKELVARAIHQFGPRRDGAFVAINCGAIPENLIESELFGHVRGAFTSATSDRLGRFEAAEKGCLLLDEIGDLPMPMQVKLLRVLDSGVIERVGSSQPITLDVRIIAATNKDLHEEVRAGRFRQDLYFRLAVLSICVPPLRERMDDIVLLASHFLQTACPENNPHPGLSSKAIEALRAHDWPGNVRELKNAMAHAAAVAPARNILIEDLPESLRRRNQPACQSEQQLRRAVVGYATSLRDGESGRCHQTLEQVEKALILFALGQLGKNQSEAAEYLGLHRNTLRSKLRELGIDTPDEWKQ